MHQSWVVKVVEEKEMNATDFYFTNEMKKLSAWDNLYYTNA